MRGTDIVPLAEAFGLLAAKRHVVTERFYPLLKLLVVLANVADEAGARRVTAIAWAEPGTATGRVRRRRSGRRDRSHRSTAAGRPPSG